MAGLLPVDLITVRGMSLQLGTLDGVKNYQSAWHVQGLSYSWSRPGYRIRDLLMEAEDSACGKQMVVFCMCKIISHLHIHELVRK